MKFSIEELILANELCFPKDFEEWLKINFKEEEVKVLALVFKFKGSRLLNWIFQYSRAELETNNLGEKIDILIESLIRRN